MRMVKVIGDSTVGANRLLSPESSGILGVYLQQQRPFIPAEGNLLQDALNERRRQLATVVSRPGWTIRTPLEAPTLLSLTIPIDYVVINGETIHVVADNGTSPITVAISDKPVGSNTYDIVFLEMWYQEVAALGTADAAVKTLPTRGWVDGTIDLATDASYVIKDPLVTSVPETSRRIQIRWRVRVVNTGTNPGTNDGIATTSTLYARGGNASTSGVSGKNFTALTGALLSNVYRAGNGDVTDAGSFGDVTGYVWAVPICTIVHTSGDTAGGPVSLDAITDQRKSATNVGAVSISGNNTTVTGDDVIFVRATGGAEIGRFRSTGLTSNNYDVEAAQLVSTVSDGTTAPLAVNNQVPVTNLVAGYLASNSAAPTGANALVAGNLAGNIPISNGAINANLVANAVGSAGATATFNNNAPSTLLKLGTDGLVPTANLPATGTVTSATRATYLVDGGGTDRAASYFLTTTGKAADSYKADNATNASLATRASYLVDDQNGGDRRASDFMLATAFTVAVVATPNTVPKRDAMGNINSSFTGNLTGVATVASLLQVQPIVGGSTEVGAAWSREQVITLLPAGNYTPKDPANIQNAATPGTWGAPFSTATAGFYPSGLGNPTRFPWKPSYWSLGSGRRLYAKPYGIVFAPTDFVGSATFGFRIRLYDTGTTLAQATTTLSANGMWDLGDIDYGASGGGFELTTTSLSQNYDGIWLVEVMGGSGSSQWACTKLTLRVWVD